MSYLKLLSCFLWHYWILRFPPPLIAPFLFLPLCPYSCELPVFKWPQVSTVHHFWVLMRLLSLILGLHLSLIYRKLVSPQFESFSSSKIQSHSLYAPGYFTLECLVLTSYLTCPKDSLPSNPASFPHFLDSLWHHQLFHHFWHILFYTYSKDPSSSSQALSFLHSQWHLFPQDRILTPSAH